MRLTIETARETDGRWIAEVVELPGVMVYGRSRQDATNRVEALALRTVAEGMEHSEAPAKPDTIRFTLA